MALLFLLFVLVAAIGLIVLFIVPPQLFRISKKELKKYTRLSVTRVPESLATEPGSSTVLAAFRRATNLDCENYTTHANCYEGESFGSDVVLSCY